MKKHPGELAVEAVSEARTNVFFGFHDLCPFDPSDRYLAAVRVKSMDRPPGQSDAAEIIIIDTVKRTTEVAGRTTAWNFPQGARQQWWPGRPNVVVYNAWHEGRLWAVAKTSDGKEVERIPNGIYSFSPTGDKVFSIDFARLHRLGGYGYSQPADATASMPEDGIFEYDCSKGRSRLIVSTADVAKAIGLKKDAAQLSQYLTHIVPSPDGAHICFLHRYWLADGGLNTTVCVSKSDGTALRILAGGIYSHFDWATNHTILIWGRSNDRSIAIRRSGAPLARELVKIARPLYRAAKKGLPAFFGIRDHYHLFDIRGSQTVPFLPKKLLEDGHPSFLTCNRNWMITDTYPDQGGLRKLYLVQVDSATLWNLGTLREPRPEQSKPSGYLESIGVGAEAIVRHGYSAYWWSRSGYACDFHPRFDRAGKRLCIDSSHLGYRGLYLVDLNAILREPPPNKP